MDGFSYTNIFDTKGIEYLAIITFFLILIPFWLLLNKKEKIKEQFLKAAGALTAAVLRIPQGIFYSKNHTWAYLEKSGTAKVGVDDLLMHITGVLNIRQLKNPGEHVSKGELMAEMDQKGKSLKVFSPISGTIVNSNPELDMDPGLLNKDPYGQGWIYKIKPSIWVEQIPTLLIADDATQWFNRELLRYKDFLATNMVKYSPDPLMITLQDGGELSDNSLSGLPEEMWQDFQKEFLNP